MDKVKSVKDRWNGAKDSAQQHMSKATREVLNTVRELAKPYTNLVPGGSIVADAVFDAVNDLIDTHGDEVNQILTDTASEIQQAVSQKDMFGMSVGIDVVRILQKRLGQLAAIVQRAGENRMSKLAKKYPQISDTLGDAYERLRRMAEKTGLEGEKIVEDTTKEVRFSLTMRLSGR